MKKVLFILSMLLLLVGCDSKEEYFSKNCLKKISSNDLKDVIDEKVIYNNNDEVKEIQISREFDGKSKEVISYIKKSIKDYNNDLLKNKNVKIQVVTDEDSKYSLKYYYDVDKMKKKELDNLDIKKNSIKYLKYLQKQEFDCK